MIKLKNIKIDGDIVQCNFIPEDSQTEGKFELDCKKREFCKMEKPKGYEWCANHLEHAKSYLLKLYDSNKPLPSEKIIMWY